MATLKLVGGPLDGKEIKDPAVSGYDSEYICIPQVRLTKPHRVDHYYRRHPDGTAHYDRAEASPEIQPGYWNKDS